MGNTCGALTFHRNGSFGRTIMPSETWAFGTAAPFKNPTLHEDNIEVEEYFSSDCLWEGSLELTSIENQKIPVQAKLVRVENASETHILFSAFDLRKSTKWDELSSSQDRMNSIENSSLALAHEINNPLAILVSKIEAITKTKRSSPHFSGSFGQ